MRFIDFDKTIPYVKKQGIAGFFQLIFHNFFDMVVLNIIFIFTSLPVFTIGASYAALIHVSNKIVSDEPVSPVKEYFSAFKKLFYVGLLNGLFFTLTAIIIGYSTIYYFSLGGIFYLFSFLGMTCLILLIMTFSFYFPILTKVRQKNIVIYKNSFILALTYLMRSFGFGFTVVIIFMITLALFPYSVLFIALFPISFIALLSSFLAAGPIQKHLL